jgi:hypothetical protein
MDLQVMQCLHIVDKGVLLTALDVLQTAKAASTSVFSNTSLKCSTFPAPEEAMTGMEKGFTACHIKKSFH